MRIDKQELRRQIFHLFLGIVIVLLFHFGFLSLRYLFTLIIIGCILAVVASKWKVPGVDWFLRNFERDNVRFPGEGATFYVLGCFLVLAIFPRNIAFASIMILAVGDSFATFVGKGIGKKKLRGEKTLEGTLAGTLTGFFTALIFVNVTAAFFGSLIAMLFEAAELKVFKKTVDDNLFIPVIAGIVMYGVIMIWP